MKQDSDQKIDVENVQLNWVTRFIVYCSRSILIGGDIYCQPQAKAIINKIKVQT